MARHRSRSIELTRREGRVARPFLAENLRISLPTVTNLVKDLMKRELLIEDGFSESRGGRRAALLRLNPEYAYAVGVEVNLSGVKAALFNLADKIVAERVADTRPITNPDSTINRIIGMVGPLMAQAPPKRLRGIGVGIAGLVDRTRGVSIKFPHCENWTDVPISERLAEHFDMPVLVDNDVQTSALAEFRHGVARGIDTFLYLHLGRGLRLGMMINGQIYHGVNGRAGELGHIVVDDDGPICYCGNYGCLESLASPPAIVEQVREAIGKGVESSIPALAGGSIDAVDIETILTAADQHDRLAINLLERAGTYIGRILANIANLFDPSMVVLSGILASRKSPLVEVIDRTFRRSAMPEVRDTVKIRPSAFSDSPCARGAATLVFDRMFEEMFNS
jgi:predicted NBD/HSP70 family sugar kinase